MKNTSCFFNYSMLAMWNDVILTSQRSREFSITDQFNFYLLKQKGQSRKAIIIIIQTPASNLFLLYSRSRNADSISSEIINTRWATCTRVANIQRFVQWISVWRNKLVDVLTSYTYKGEAYFLQRESSLCQLNNLCIDCWHTFSVARSELPHRNVSVHRYHTNSKYSICSLFFENIIFCVQKY